MKTNEIAVEQKSGGESYWLVYKKEREREREVEGKVKAQQRDENRGDEKYAEADKTNPAFCERVSKETS